MTQFKRIGITVKSRLEDKELTVVRIVEILLHLGAQIYFDPHRSDDLEIAKKYPHYASADDIDLLLVIGGDGTILRAIREFADFSVPILSVNRGTVGFLAEVEFPEADRLLPELLSGDGVLEERSILDVRAERSGNTFFQGFALNEAVIAQGNIARLVDLKTSVNGEELATFHADGLIVATPTGSTAYSLAAGGPIVHPTLPATILTPINPHSFSQKPIVIPSDQTIAIEVSPRETKFQDANVILTLDGQVYSPVKGGDIITVCKSGKSIRFLRRAQDTFYKTLRAKLKWGERPE